MRRAAGASCFGASSTSAFWRSWATGPAYGYEMTKRLRARGLSIVGEGSIYPLLGRLERDGLVETRRAASNGGPPRKYYSLSPEGERALEAGVKRMAGDA